MQAIPLERPSPAQAAVVSVATFVALAFLGSVLAYWTWAWLAPRPEPRAQATAPAGGRVEAAYDLFGNVRRDANGVVPTGIPVRLLGIVAATARRPGSGPGNGLGYAVLRTDSKKTAVVLEGDEVEPGLRLVEIHVDHIVLQRNGAREKVGWPEAHGK
jgi:general secretion pathway protein C